MIARIILHSRALIRRPAHTPFHIAGIIREVSLAYYLSTPYAVRLAYALVG